MCNKDCEACPFAFTDLSEEVQNYGCLPTPYEIVVMRVVHGKTWACHADYSIPCKGAILFLEDHGQPYKVIDDKLVNETDDWGQYVSGTVEIGHSKKFLQTIDKV